MSIISRQLLTLVSQIKIGVKKHTQITNHYNLSTDFHPILKKEYKESAII